MMQDVDLNNRLYRDEGQTWLKYVSALWRAIQLRAFVTLPAHLSIMRLSIHSQLLMLIELQFVKVAANKRRLHKQELQW
jgi:hypothetical protein